LLWFLDFTGSRKVKTATWPGIHDTVVQQTYMTILVSRKEAGVSTSDGGTFRWRRLVQSSKPYNKSKLLAPWKIYIIPSNWDAMGNEIYIYKGLFGLSRDGHCAVYRRIVVACRFSVPSRMEGLHCLSWTSCASLGCQINALVPKNVFDVHKILSVCISVIIHSVPKWFGKTHCKSESWCCTRWGCTVRPDWA
jgi:hypothetical protein